MEQKRIKVRRANVLLTINAEDAEKYRNKGYDILNEDGTVDEAATPSDINVLKRAYEVHTKKIKDLEAEVASLKTKLKVAGTSKQTANKTKKTAE